MTTFRRFLVPFDGSPLSARAIEPLRPLLVDGAEVTLVRVVEPRRPDLHDTGPAAELQLQDLLETLRSELGTGTRLRMELARGDAADEIVRLSREGEVDLVVMSTHGRTGLLRWVRGSVAEAVLRRCAAPLLLCNPQALEARSASTFARILVPLDGSPESERIVPLVEAVARGHGAQVTLLRVEPAIVSEVPSPMLEGSLWDPAALEQSLAGPRDRLLAAGLRVDASTAYGVVAAELLKAAAGADLLAMTTHGRSGLSRLWSGSVAEEVLRHVRCPVLVLRAAEA